MAVITDADFVDAHVHYWQPSVNDSYEALRSRPIYRDILPGDFPACAAHVHVSAVSSPRSVLAEARWLEILRRETGFPSAVIGTIDPALPFTDTEASLRAQAEIITQPAGIPSYLPAIRDSPDAAFVLEHAGWPGGAEPEQFRQWREAIAPLAAFDNVDCKISGLGMALRTTDPARLRPFVETCLDLFGVDRCFFGSNFPVDSVAGTYADLIGAYRRTTAALSDGDEHRLFAANARHRYRLPG
ncbi:amidohydrolase family protein [Nonomuraea wenchangensis]